jgi:hypothetical protein
VPFAHIECAGLEHGLTHVSLPLQGVGATYFVADTDLTPAERQQLDALIGPPAGPLSHASTDDRQVRRAR